MRSGWGQCWSQTYGAQMLPSVIWKCHLELQFGGKGGGKFCLETLKDLMFSYTLIHILYQWGLKKCCSETCNRKRVWENLASEYSHQTIPFRKQISVNQCSICFLICLSGWNKMYWWTAILLCKMLAVFCTWQDSYQMMGYIVPRKPSFTSAGW